MLEEEDDDATFVPYDMPIDASSYVKNLLVDADEDDDVRLHEAALCGNIDPLVAILSDPRVRNQWLNHKVRPLVAPPLRLAVTGGHLECVRLLLMAGAEVDLEDIKGQTSLFVATSERHLPIMKLLLEHGASPEGSPMNRGTPLMIAVRDGFSEGVKLLLSFGANPEPFDKLQSCVPGWPLHHSVVYAHFSCFLALLQHGAFPSLEKLLSKSLAAEATIARLSIPHTILKYAKNNPEFVSLYHECGGSLVQKNQKQQTVLDDSSSPVSSKSYQNVLKLTGQPMSLKSISRLRIRKRLGRRRLKSISSLDLPPILQAFLRYEEYESYASRTKLNEHIKILPKEEIT